MKASNNTVSCLTAASMLLWIGATEIPAADHYVRQGATGANNGSDWTNAWTNLPSPLQRGDTYYLADGTYGSYTFDDNESGTLSIIIKKATVSDHGTSVGWYDTYGDEQAIFTSWSVYSDYYLFDGRTRNSDWYLGQLSEYGIRIHNTSGIPLRLDDGGGTTGDHLVFRYIDIEAPGREYLGEDYGGVDVVYSLGSTFVTFSRCALRDSDRTIFLTRSVADWTVEFSYLARNASSPYVHGEIWSDDGSDNITIRYSVLEDPEGTAALAILNGSGIKSPENTADNWQIYGNIVTHTSSYTGEGISGFVFSANDVSNCNWSDNWRIYNNTFYQIQGLWSGVVIQAGSGNVVENNIWYNSVRTNNQGAAFNYNWYYDTVEDGDDGADIVICSYGCGIFIDAAHNDFQLAMPVPGVSLAGQYNADMFDNTRGADAVWDRGAFEFNDLSDIDEDARENELPEDFVLYQNYPNPFNSGTTVSLSVSSKSFVSLKIYDILGREVSVLVSEELSAGWHNFLWNAANASSGVYFYRLKTHEKSLTRRMLLLK